MARTKNVNSNLAEQIHKVSRRKPPIRKKKEYNLEDLVPSGLTMLNLACSDNPFGAYALGGMVSMPGASSAGKTILSLTCLAECAITERFDEYDLIHDDAEERSKFDLEYLFSRRVKERIKSPKLGNSKTIQTFEANQISALKSGRPFIYVLDSFDALSSDEELEKEFKRAMALAKSAEAATKIAGSFGSEKAKIIGQTLRIINNELERSKSLLLIIQQRRQKMGAPAFSDPWTTAGGEAPFYYSNHQIWLNKLANIKYKNRITGTEAVAKLKKNSVTGKLREAEFDIFVDFGVDDIGSVVNFLVDEGHWEKKGHTIHAHEFNEAETRDKLIDIIEEDCLEEELAKIAGKVWKDIEDELLSKRKRKYE